MIESSGWTETGADARVVAAKEFVTLTTEGGVG